MDKSNPKHKPIRILRLILQIIFFIFLPALYYNTLNGIKDIYTATIHHNWSAINFPQLLEVIAIIPITILLGRFFCGWMCAFGSFFDFIYQTAHKIFKIKFKINEKLDAKLKYIKYGLLLFIVVFMWTLGASVFSAASPWDVFGMVATVGKAPALSFVITNLTVGFVIFLLLILGSVFIERFFCRYLCPLGALFAILSKFKITRLHKPTAGCGKCKICTKSCPMGIPLYQKGIHNSGECINCMKCVEDCPRNNVSHKISSTSLRPLVTSTVTVATMAGIYYVGDLTPTSNAFTSALTSSSESSSTDRSSWYDDATSTASQDVTSSSTSETPTLQSSSPVEQSSSNPSTSNSTSGTYRDGTYQGTGTGFRGGTTTVSVTVKNDKITDIQALSYEDDRPFFEQAYSSVTSNILSKQSTSVDAVSGATYSSNGIMDAVANALLAAKA